MYKDLESLRKIYSLIGFLLDIKNNILLPLLFLNKPFMSYEAISYSSCCEATTLRLETELTNMGRLRRNNKHFRIFRNPVNFKIWLK